LKNLSKRTAQRLVRCYYLAREARALGVEFITSSKVALLLGVDETQIRKDMASVNLEGVPRKGYPVEEIINRLEEVFGLKKDRNAVLVGAGNLGRALLNYPGFLRYGVRIVGAFDKDPQKYGREVGGVWVYPVEELKERVKVFEACLGIIAVPPREAQGVADVLVEAGVEGIWNFSPALIRVPAHIALRNECLESGLVMLLHEMEVIKKSLANS